MGDLRTKMFQYNFPEFVILLKAKHNDSCMVIPVVVRYDLESVATL